MSSPTPSRHTLKFRILVPTLIACCPMLLTPFTALACGGFFSPDVSIDQNAERLIFTVNPGSITLYEQIHYTGTASDFAWVLPVPSVPKLDTTTVDVFRDLDMQTAPRFIAPEPPSCGLAPFRAGTLTGGGAPPPAGNVNVYSGGNVGPYSYDVIGSSDPTALLKWLQSHHYRINTSMLPLISIYTSSHMLFLAMRLQPQAGIQDIQPIKVTFATSQPQITIPMRMAAVASSQHLDLLVWIFGSSRFAPQNYQSFQISQQQLSVEPYAGANYTQLIDNAVSQANGHAFITEYAQPTNNLHATTPLLNQLLQSYSYVTRLRTRMSPDQMTVDPTFAVQSGLPNVEDTYDLSNRPVPTTCSGFNLFLGSLGQGAYLLAFLVLVLLIGAVTVIIELIRGRRSTRL